MVDRSEQRYQNSIFKGGCYLAATSNLNSWTAVRLHSTSLVLLFKPSCSSLECDRQFSCNRVRLFLLFGPRSRINLESSASILLDCSFLRYQKLFAQLRMPHQFWNCERNLSDGNSFIFSPLDSEPSTPFYYFKVRGITTSVYFLTNHSGKTPCQAHSQTLKWATYLVFRYFSL